jgi:hypothetical protein
MSQMPQLCERGADGQVRQRMSVNVNDPVARTNMNWMVGYEDQPKVVQIYHWADPPTPVKREQLSPEELAKRQKAMEAARAAQQLRQKEWKNEDLGVKQINGITARGTRMTRTIPAGEEGNDQPLVVVQENWRSSDFDLLLAAISDDPRRGRTTMEYEELNLGEPDAALFAPPQGYTVQERSADGAIIQK